MFDFVILSNFSLVMAICFQCVSTCLPKQTVIRTKEARFQSTPPGRIGCIGFHR